MPGPVVRLSLQDPAEKPGSQRYSEGGEGRDTTLRFDTTWMTLASSPVGEVVVGVGHVDQPLDEVGALDEAEKDLQNKSRKKFFF